MFSASLSLAVLFFGFSFFHGDLFICNAIPTESPSLWARTTTIPIGPPGNRQNYELELLSTQGYFSRAYEVVGGYQGIPAILKLVREGEDRTKTQTELNNLNKVGLYLWAQSNNRVSFFVMRDVRRDFPNPGNVKKLFSDWYLEDENMDVITSLATLQASVHEVLINFAMEETIGLLHRDCHLNNVYTDDTFTNIMPVDWAPPDSAEGINGVVPVNADRREGHLQAYDNWLSQRLPEMYSLQAFSDRLAGRGQQLRPADAQLLAGQNAQK